MLLVTVSLLLQMQTPTDVNLVDPTRPQEKAAAPREPIPDFTQESQATFGAIFNEGNVSAISGRAGGYYQMRYLVHGLRAELGGGVASIAQDPELDPADGFDVPLYDIDNTLNTTASGRLRYDFFLSTHDSLYASGFSFHDSAANLLIRLRADTGYRRFIFNQEKHSLTAELGAVYTIDNGPVGVDSNGDGSIDLADRVGFEDSGGTYGARIAANYLNALLDNLQYTTTAELVPNIFPAVAAPFEKARLGDDNDDLLGFGEASIFTWNHTFTVTVSEALNVGIALNLLYDAGAIARRNAYTNHDITASFQLGYKLF